MKRPKQDGWYVRKSFPHLDLPLAFTQAREMVTHPERVARHSFLPFLGYTDTKRRFKPKLPQKYVNKNRDIKYCSHKDGYVHSYYALQLSEKYEEFLRQSDFGKAVIGYRAGLGTNVHMAKNAFNEIKRRGNCTVLAIDISDFFPSIDHQTLLKNLKTLIGCARLPDDWFAVFKSMTKFSWVELDELISVLGLDRKELPKPLCDIETLRKLRGTVPNLIKKNRQNFGIPQGSPISALFSNIFMIDFDEYAYHLVSSVGGYYRRYSDDIFVVCDHDHAEQIQSALQAKIAELGTAISINSEKTEKSKFGLSPSGDLQCDQPVNYLGFSFDGVSVRLRPSTLSRYYRRMTYAARGVSRAAKDNKLDRRPYKRKLYRQFTHLGRSNFYTYARRAAVVLEDETPRRQLRRHFTVLTRKIRRHGK